MAIRDLTKSTVNLPVIGSVGIVSVIAGAAVLMVVFGRTKKASTTKTTTIKTNFRK